MANQRPIPESYLILLADILGVEPSILRMSSKQAQRLGDLTPAIWYKFRGDELTDADRESVVLIRLLGHFQNEIEDVTGRKAVGWKPLFEAIRQGIDAQAPPSEQGRRAARLFRESTGLSQCATGIGIVFRANLRRLGILIIESPIQESRVEGCSFYVGAHPMDRPCVFANTYHSTWFRRNVILMHEVAHAIFDASSSGASLDFVNPIDQTELSDNAHKRSLRKPFCRVKFLIMLLSRSASSGTNCPERTWRNHRGHTSRTETRCESCCRRGIRSS